MISGLKRPGEAKPLYLAAPSAYLPSLFSVALTFFSAQSSFPAKKFEKPLYSFHGMCYNITRVQKWGISTVGSTLHWQCRGQEFESPMLHHDRATNRPVFLFIKHKIQNLYISLYKSGGGSLYSGAPFFVVSLTRACEHAIHLYQSMIYFNPLAPYGARRFIGCL